MLAKSKSPQNAHMYTCTFFETMFLAWASVLGTCNTNCCQEWVIVTYKVLIETHPTMGPSTLPSASLSFFSLMYCSRSAEGLMRNERNWLTNHANGSPWKDINLEQTHITRVALVELVLQPFTSLNCVKSRVVCTAYSHHEVYMHCVFSKRFAFQVRWKGCIFHVW